MISKFMITGTREITPEIVKMLRFSLGWLTYVSTEDTLLLQGNAKGVDTEDRALWNWWGYKDHGFSARWDLYGKAAGGIRNQQMVDESPELCLAFPGPKSVGTWDAVRRAKSADILTFVLTDNVSMKLLFDWISQKELSNNV